MKIIGLQLSNRRRDQRISVMPIQIELDGETYTSLDWSLGGFLIEGYEGQRRPGEEMMVGLQVIAQGVEFNHVARAEVVRIDPHGNQFAANFVALDNATLDTLEGWLTGKLRRKNRHKEAG
jgi:hypothetical protein